MSFPCSSRTGLVALCALWSAPAWSQAPLSPQDALAAGLSLHPDVVAAQAALASARGERSAAAVFLGNPNASGRVSSDGERYEAALTQPVSLTGQGWHARSAAAHRIEAAERSLSRAKRVAAAELRTAQIDAAVAVSQVHVAQEAVDLARELTAAVQLQADNGAASQLDLQLVRLAEVQAAAQLMQATEAQAQALVVLSAMMGRDVSAAELDLLALSVPDGLSATDERDDVRAAVALRDAAAADQRTARAAALSPLSVGVFIGREDGVRFAGPTASWDLPVFQRNQQQVGASNGAAQQADAALSRLQAQVQTEQRTATARAEQARDLSVSLPDDPIALAGEALRGIELGYLEGQLDLSTTLLLQRQVLQGESAAFQRVAAELRAAIDRLLAYDDDRLLGGAR